MTSKIFMSMIDGLAEALAADRPEVGDYVMFIGIGNLFIYAGV